MSDEINNSLTDEHFDDTADSKPPYRTRRGVLIGGLGALVAGVASLVGKSTPASAADGDALTLGESNSASSSTFLDATDTSGTIGFQCNVTGSGSLALYGATGGGIGVQGSDQGDSTSEAGVGVYGTSIYGTGVLGTSVSPTAPGVFAQNSGGGPALQVHGTVSFSLSGMVRVPKGARSVTVGVEGLSSSSLVLATLQKHDTASVAISAAIPDSTNSTIEIFLTQPASSSLPVAWFVVN